MNGARDSDECEPYTVLESQFIQRPHAKSFKVSMVRQKANISTITQGENHCKRKTNGRDDNKDNMVRNRAEDSDQFIERTGFVSVYNKNELECMDDGEMELNRVRHSISVLSNFKEQNNRFVVQLLGWREDEDSIEVITEYLPDSLSDMVARGEVYSEEDAIFLLKSLLLSVHEMHHVKNVFNANECYMNVAMHPASIRFYQNNEDYPKLLFSNAGDLYREENLTTKKRSHEIEQMIKVNEYSAPETLKHKRISSKSNMWTVGCIFYELLFNEKFIDSITFENIKKYNRFPNSEENILGMNEIYNQMRYSSETLRSNLICKDTSISNFSISCLLGLLSFNERDRYDWEAVKQNIFSLDLDKSIENYDMRSVNHSYVSSNSIWTSRIRCSINQSNTSVLSNMYVSFTDDKRSNRTIEKSQILNESPFHLNGATKDEGDISLNFLKESFMYGVLKKSLFTNIPKIEQERVAANPIHQRISSELFEKDKPKESSFVDPNASFSELFIPLADPSKGLIFQGNKSFTMSNLSRSNISQIQTTEVAEPIEFSLATCSVAIPTTFTTFNGTKTKVVSNMSKSKENCMKQQIIPIQPKDIPILSEKSQSISNEQYEIQQKSKSSVESQNMSVLASTFGIQFIDKSNCSKPKQEDAILSTKDQYVSFKYQIEAPHTSISSKEFNQSQAYDITDVKAQSEINISYSQQQNQNTLLKESTKLLEKSQKTINQDQLLNAYSLDKSEKTISLDKSLKFNLLDKSAYKTFISQKSSSSQAFTLNSNQAGNFKQQNIPNQIDQVHGEVQQQQQQQQSSTDQKSDNYWQNAQIDDNKSLVKLIQQHQLNRQIKYSPLLNQYDSSCSQEDDESILQSGRFYDEKEDKNAFLQKILAETEEFNPQNIQLNPVTSISNTNLNKSNVRQHPSISSSELAKENIENSQQIRSRNKSLFDERHTYRKQNTSKGIITLMGSQIEKKAEGERKIDRNDQQEIDRSSMNNEIQQSQYSVHNNSFVNIAQQENEEIEQLVYSDSDKASQKVIEKSQSDLNRYEQNKIEAGQILQLQKSTIDRSISRERRDTPQNEYNRALSFGQESPNETGNKNENLFKNVNVLPKKSQIENNQSRSVSLTASRINQPENKNVKDNRQIKQSQRSDKNEFENMQNSLVPPPLSTSFQQSPRDESGVKEVQSKYINASDMKSRMEQFQFHDNLRKNGHTNKQFEQQQNLPIKFEQLVSRDELACSYILNSKMRERTGVAIDSLNKIFSAQAQQEINGNTSMISAQGYAKEVYYDKKNQMLVQRERSASLVHSQIQQPLHAASSLKDIILKEQYKQLEANEELFVFKSFLDPIEFQIQTYFQTLLQKIQDLFKHYNNEECLNCVLVLMTILRIRLHRLIFKQLMDVQNSKKTPMDISEEIIGTNSNENGKLTKRLDNYNDEEHCKSRQLNEQNQRNKFPSRSLSQGKSAYEKKEEKDRKMGQKYLEDLFEEKARMLEQKEENENINLKGHQHVKLYNQIVTKNDITREEQVREAIKQQVRKKVCEDKNIKELDKLIVKFLERSTLESSNDLIEPHIYAIYRKYIFVFYNQLTKKIYDSQNETNSELKLHYDKLIQMSRLSYHLLIVSHYQKVFKLYFKELFQTKEMNHHNLYKFVDDKIAFMDIYQLHQERQNLKHFLNIQFPQPKKDNLTSLLPSPNAPNLSLISLPPFPIKKQKYIS